MLAAEDESEKKLCMRRRKRYRSKRFADVPAPTEKERRIRFAGDLSECTHAAKKQRSKQKVGSRLRAEEQAENEDGTGYSKQKLRDERRKVNQAQQLRWEKEAGLVRGWTNGGLCGGGTIVCVRSPWRTRDIHWTEKGCKVRVAKIRC